ncbi:histidine kinase [Pseudonocardia tropica]|uniref:histidine kinase n=1 Tax=Pseudonocardia tropica TaxID=681289 RepID=A0ABV1JVH5_9PSEU
MRRVRETVGRRPGWAACAALGTLAFVPTLLLPWHEPEFRLGPGVAPAMAAAGVAILLAAASVPRGPTGGTAPVTGLLGVAVLAYPSLLALAAAGAGGPVAGVLAGGWHVLALTLVTLAPVLAGGRAVGRRHRRWEAAVLGAAAASLALDLTVLAGGGATWAGVALAVFLGSFAVAPVATWTAVAGTGGETRRRAILAALASVVPVAVIAWCTTLGVLVAGIGAGDDVSVSALMLGFAAGTLLCALATLATLAPAGAVVLRTRVVVRALHALLGVLVLIAGTTVALLLPADVVAPGWALLVGAVAAAALAWPWLRLHAWLGRVVDPSAELRHELSLIGDVAEGEHRRAALLVLRRLVEDPELTLHLRVDADTWAGADAAVSPAPGDAVVLATGDGAPTVLARASGPDAAARLAPLGDCTPLLRAALLEARVVHASGRAAAAAEHERRRIAQDLHDGLQGRLLGLALNLQLSGQAVDDPAARLLLEETVGTLRAAVEEVRALGGGRQPELLARGGLAPALESLFRGVRPVVALDVPATRLATEVETTAYLVVSEAAANALKHAGSDAVGVRVRTGRGSVVVTVTDDGRGGADPRSGSGLRGLAERVAATGGVLVVRDATGGPGTVVEAVLPCGS